METVGDARSFLSAAREVALNKPIIVIKAGRTAAGGKAAASHTGSMTGSDDVLDAAFRRSGVLRVNNIADLFYTAEVLSKQPRPKGPKLTILTNAGGAGIIAADACERVGVAVPQISKSVKERLASFLPPEAGLGNPIDMIATAGSSDYERTLHETLSEVDAAIVIFRPPIVFNEPPETVADGIVRVAEENPGKPILVCTLSRSADLETFRKRLAAARIPVYTMPETAVDALASLCRVGKLWRVRRPIAAGQLSHPGGVVLFWSWSPAPFGPRRALSRRAGAPGAGAGA